MTDVNTLKGITTLNDKEIQVTQKLSYPRRQTHLNENLANTGNPRSTSWGKFFLERII